MHRHFRIDAFYDDIIILSNSIMFFSYRRGELRAKAEQKTIVFVVEFIAAIKIIIVCFGNANVVPPIINA